MDELKELADRILWRPMDEIELIRAAWLRYLQFENECYAGVTGKPCHSHKCGCALEMQSYIDKERSAPGQ